MAFGFDDQQIERAVHAPERRRRLIVGGLVTAVVVGAAAAGWGWWSLATPSGVARMAQGLIAPVPLAFDEVVIERPGGLFDTGSWQVSLSTVRIDLPAGGTATIDKLVVPWTDVANAWAMGHRDVAKIEVTGFSVTLPSQPPLAPFTPFEGTTWVVGEVTLTDGAVDVAADGPRRAAKVEAISGRLEKVRYDTGMRLLGGKGELTAGRATIGTLVVEAPTLRVVAKDSTIGFEGHASLLGTKAAITAQIQHVHQGAALKMVVEPEALSVEALVSAWTGGESPLHGPLDGRIVVRAGGEVPRGAPVIETESRVPGARLVLGPPGNPASKAVVKAVPTLRVDKETGDVLLPDLVGGIALTSEGASVLQLMEDAAIQTRVRGALAPEPALLVRTVSSMDWWRNPGRGAFLSREAGAWVVRPATREELVPPAPATTPAAPPAP